MLEEYGLKPFSATEIADEIQKKLKPDLEYMMDAKPVDMKGEHAADADLCYQDHLEQLRPLLAARQGPAAGLIGQMVGGEYPEVGITKRALKAFMESPQLQPTAKRIIKLMSTPEDSWKEAANKLCREYRLNQEADYDYPYAPSYDYTYQRSLLATGSKGKIELMESGHKDFKEGADASMEIMFDEIRDMGRLSSPLSQMENFQYRKETADAFGEAAAGEGTIKKPILLYRSNSLTVLQNSKGGYRFVGFGNAVPFLKTMGEKALEIGLGINMQDQKLMPLSEERKYWLLDLADVLSRKAK